MMTIKNKINKDVFGILGTVALIGYIVFSVIDGTAYQKERKEYGCFTIGVTDGFKYAHKQGGRGVYYIYHYQGKEYRDWDIAMDGTKYRGVKYLVKLSTKDPENAEMDVTIPIEGDSIPVEYRPLCSEIEKLE